MSILPRIMNGVLAPEDAELINKIHTMPAAQYHSDKTAISQGALQEIERSPLHFITQWAKPYRDVDGTGDMLIGSLVHEALLEPEVYAARIMIPKFGDQRFKEFKEKKAKWKEENPIPEGAKIIEEADKRQVENMCMAALSNKEIRDMLAAKETRKEATIYWVDESSFILNRARLDAITPDAIFDIKTLANASPSEVAKAIANFGYDFQAAHYCAAGDALGLGTYSDYRFIAIEREEPFGCKVYRLKHSDLARAHARRVNAQNRLRDCIDARRWECYGDDVEEITLPGWHTGAKIEVEAF